jgi:hypothetical protein
MNNKLMYTLIVLIGLLVVWFLYSWISVRNIEAPQYEVVSVHDGYEIRKYKSYIIAETTIVGATDRNDAARKGFPIVAGYIFGDNTKQNKIAMTVPVNTEETDFEKIAMTVPVNTEQEDAQGAYKVSFVLPSEYTLETLPIPNDSRVIIREIPSRTVAVKKFSWSTSESTIRKNEQALLSALKKDGRTPARSTNVARYNPPWTIPFMLRTEVQVVIE